SLSLDRGSSRSDSGFQRSDRPESAPVESWTPSACDPLILTATAGCLRGLLAQGIRRDQLENVDSQTDRVAKHRFSAGLTLEVTTTAGGPRMSRWHCTQNRGGDLLRNDWAYALRVMSTSPLPSSTMLARLRPESRRPANLSGRFAKCQQLIGAA